MMRTCFQPLPSALVLLSALALAGLVAGAARGDTPAEAPAETTAEPAAVETAIATLEQELREAEEGFALAFAERDFERFSAFVADDAVFFDGPRALYGKAAVLATWAGYFEGPEPPFAWRPERVAVREGGDEGMSTGPVLTPDGVWVATFVSIWRRRPAGGWEVVFDVGPRCPPPPESGTAAAGD